MDYIKEKICSKCSVSKPATQSYYAKDENLIDGLSHQCKSCDDFEDKYSHMMDVERRVARLDSQSLRVLDEYAKRGRNTHKVSAPHLATVLEDLITVWGGSLGFAQRCLGEYLAAKPGSIIRQRYNVMIANLIGESSRQGYVQPPLDKMSDDELEELYMRRKEELRFKIMDTNGRSLPHTG